MIPETWLDALCVKPEPCWVQVPPESKLSADHLLSTHESTSANVKEHFKTTDDTVVIAEQKVFPRQTMLDVKEWAKTVPFDAATAYHTQIKFFMTSEAAVSLANDVNILTTVYDGLQGLILPRLRKRTSVFNQYTMAIIPQGTSVSDNGRCDHLLCLVPIRLVDALKMQVSGERYDWCYVEEFMKGIQTWVRWHKGLRTAQKGGAAAESAYRSSNPEPELPSLMLCIVEDKKQFTIDPTAFGAGYHDGDDRKYVNARSMLPQVRKYSVDGRCPLVVLSDYLQIMLFKIDDLLERVTIDGKPTFRKRQGRDKTIVTVMKLEKDDLEQQRLFYFTMCIQRLLDAKLIAFTKPDRVTQGRKQLVTHTDLDEYHF